MEQQERRHSWDNEMSRGGRITLTLFILGVVVVGVLGFTQGWFASGVSEKAQSELKLQLATYDSCAALIVDLPRLDTAYTRAEDARTAFLKTHAKNPNLWNKKTKKAYAAVDSTLKATQLTFRIAVDKVSELESRVKGIPEGRKEALDRYRVPLKHLPRPEMDPHPTIDFGQVRPAPPGN